MNDKYISDNISYREAVYSKTAFRYKINNTPPSKSLDNMRFTTTKFEELRHKLGGKPITITSFYRCHKLNQKLGGSKTSQHVTGEAIDIKTMEPDMTNKDIYNMIRYTMDFDQLIYEFGTDEEPQWVHVSFSQTYNRNEILRAYKNKETNKTFYELIQEKI